jgi:PhoH-like ATPase
MDPTIDLVLSVSPAGTGKTFMALLAGMLQSRGGESTPYEQLMVTRTLVQIGKQDLGAFPGSKEDKLAQWSENYADAMKAIAQKANETNATHSAAPASETHGPQRKATKAQRRAWRDQQQANQRKRQKLSSNVQLVAFPHLRGRSISDAFLILDEAQNTSVHEIKTFLTRAGEGSKLVVLGDASQIDLPYLNEHNNGLSVTVSLFTADSLSEEQRSRVGYVRLTEGVRSALAEMARQLFEKPIPQN